MNIQSETFSPAPVPAVRFWETGRLPYNLILTAVALVWLLAHWSHFRSAMTISSLVAMIVLAALANVCYSAGYLAEIPLQQLVPRELWSRRRWAVWIGGTLFALLLENYWIADEIYDAASGGPNISRDMFAMWTPHLASNVNFPASFAVLGFLGGSLGLFLGLAAMGVLWFARKPKLVRTVANVMGAGALLYVVLLLSFSLGSHERVLARGEEKYFCEIDCHLAYSLVNVSAEASPSLIHYKVTLRTRFDETTTSPKRPKDAPLTPSPRDARLIDDQGHGYACVAVTGMQLNTPLKPAESYNTILEFNVPSTARNLRLLLTTTSSWPDRLVIGDENSVLHKKTLMALEGGLGARG